MRRPFPHGMFPAVPIVNSESSTNNNIDIVITITRMLSVTGGGISIQLDFEPYIRIFPSSIIIWKECCVKIHNVVH